MIIKGILITAGIFLAIWGLSELIHTLRLAAIFKKGRAKLLSVIFLKPESAVLQLMFAAEQKNWMGGDFAEYIIGVTDGLSDDELEECKAVAEKRGIILCKKSELIRVSENLTFKI